jgi:general L-amino acid transport system permease protein
MPDARDPSPSRAPRAPWHDPKIRAIAFQALALILVVAAVAVVVHNTRANLERQSIASGFGFLSRTAGFDIIQHLIPYTEESSYGRAFLVALLNTILVSAVGVALATVLGFAIGVARLSRNFLVSRLALAYVEVVRNIPLLLQLFFWYFGVLRALPGPRESHALGDLVFLNIRGLYVPEPVFGAAMPVWAGLVVTAVVVGVIFVKWARLRQRRTGRQLPAVPIAVGAVVLVAVVAFEALGRPVTWVKPELAGFNFRGGLVLIPELVSLLAALTIYTAAFIAEIVRAGILSVSRGQTEAALALGLSRGQTLRLVVIPQAMRVIIPPMTSQYLNLTKNSSLAAAIAYPDLVLVFAGTVLMQTGQAVEVVALTMGVFLVLSLAISTVMNVYNRRMALVER